MKKTFFLLLIALAPAHIHVPGQTTSPTTPSLIFIKAGRLINVRAGRVDQNQGILIEGDRIKAVGPLQQTQALIDPRAQIIDLSNATVLPGLADCHTHILLQGDITAADYDEQLLKESIPYRTIRATVAVRTALLMGLRPCAIWKRKAPCMRMSMLSRR